MNSPHRVPKIIQTKKNLFFATLVLLRVRIKHFRLEKLEQCCDSAQNRAEWERERRQHDNGGRSPLALSRSGAALCFFSTRVYVRICGVLPAEWEKRLRQQSRKTALRALQDYSSTHGVIWVEVILLK